MAIAAHIIDSCVLGEVFSSYSEEELKRWGMWECETVEVQIEGMKRVFRLRFDVLTDADNVSFFFRNPDGEIASRIEVWRPLRKEDILYITYTYTVTGLVGGDPDSCRIRSPNGVYLSVNLYSLAS